MPSLNVHVRQELSEYLYTTKEVDYPSSSFETPAKTIPIDTLDDGESILEESRGVNEVYLELSTYDLEQLTSGPGDSIADELPNKLENARSDEFTVAIVQLTTRSVVDMEAMEKLVRLLDEHFDMLICPLMSAQIDQTEIAENPGSFNRFVETIELFLGAVEAHCPDSPVLGTLPAVSWKAIDELLEIYLRHPVDGFCVDFLGKKPTAKSRVRDFVVPLVTRLGKEGLHRNSLLYAVNAYRGDNRSGGPRSPAEDFFSFGLGFDVVGGLYYRPTTGWGGDGEKEFRCFYRESYEQQYVPLDELATELPDRTGFDERYVIEQARDEDELGRVQWLMEAEQMSLAYHELRSAIADGETAEFIRAKAGATENVRSVMQMARNGYENGRSSPSLGRF